MIADVSTEKKDYDIFMILEYMRIYSQNLMCFNVN